ncbi:MAG: Mrp/NBP35 family ATP-binding protein [Eggerthellaceae bacterium]|jgi:Mrp family chromosome partitioning ATPase
MAENEAPKPDPAFDPRIPPKEKPNDKSHIGKVIAVISGKGGVGKSTVTGLLASAAARTGARVGIMDSDITGPSMPKTFGVTTRLGTDGEGLIPSETAHGIKMVSTNLVLERDDMPVVWRGPILSNVVRQFFSETNWGDIDYLFVDMPPGTADVTLTAFQALPIDGVVVVTSPQDLVEMIVDKAVNMAREMDVPLIGIVENMAAFTCPDCGKTHYLFGEPKGRKLAEERSIPSYATLPIDPRVAQLEDAGRIEEADEDEALKPLLDIILER